MLTLCSNMLVAWWHLKDIVRRFFSTKRKQWKECPRHFLIRAKTYMSQEDREGVKMK